MATYRLTTITAVLVAYFVLRMVSVAVRPCIQPKHCFNETYSIHAFSNRYERSWSQRVKVQGHCGIKG